MNNRCFFKTIVVLLLSLVIAAGALPVLAITETHPICFMGWIFDIPDYFEESSLADTTYTYISPYSEDGTAILLISQFALNEEAAKREYRDLVFETVMPDIMKAMKVSEGNYSSEDREINGTNWHHVTSSKCEIFGNSDLVCMLFLDEPTHALYALTLVITPNSKLDFKADYYDIVKSMRINNGTTQIESSILETETAPTPTEQANDEWEYEELTDGTLSITGYRGEDCDLVIPNSIGGKAVTAISNYAFPGNSRLKSIVIPDGITAIVDYAFSSCVCLTDVSLGNDVKSIGENAFSGCTSLKNINLPDNVSYIGDNPFILDPVNITISPKHPYYSLVDGVLFEKNTKKLLYYPVNREESVYEIPDGILEIGSWAFYGNSYLDEVIIPASVTTIGGNAFSFSNLKTIVIPGSVTCIDAAAFSNLDNLTSITIPDSVSQISGNPFVATSADIIVSPQHPYLAISKGVLYEKQTKTLISYPYNREDNTFDVPNGIEKIGNYAFCGVMNLTEITIPDSVTAIGDFTFYNSENLSSISIPASVSDIGFAAFKGCNDSLIVTVDEDSFAEDYCILYELRYKYFDELGWLYN